MNAFTSRRAAASCGALALLLGVGALVPLSAQAAGSANGPLGLGSTVTNLGSGVSTTVSTVTGSTPAASSGTSTLGGVVTTVANTTGLTDGATGATGSTGNVLGVVDLGTGTAATPSTGLVTVPGVVSVGLDGLLGGAGSGTGTGTGTGGVGITVGSDGAGGSLVDIGLGGTGGTTGTGTGTGGGTTTSTSTSTTTGGTTTTVNNGGSTTTSSTGGGSGVPDAAPVPSIPAPSTSVGAAPQTVSTPAPTAVPTVSKVLGLSAAPSVGTVYPAKDGYRDDVVFRVAARLASAAKTGLTGGAVLTRGSKAITMWSISQPVQDLRWNGLDHGKLVPGTYVLTATMKDATGATHTTSTKVLTSPKRLIPSTQKVSALAVSGTHAMAAAARAGLSKGVVTLRLTTVASKVQGKQFLIFQKGTKQLRVPIKQGTHTTKAVRVPKELTSYTLKHTWKKGQVKLKSIRYTYSYQSLR